MLGLNLNFFGLLKVFYKLIQVTEGNINSILGNYFKIV